MIDHFRVLVRKRGSDRPALAGVLALWAVMTGIVIGGIITYSHNVPLAEDWDMVPALTGQQPNLLEWLWAQNNEHRLPLQKAIYLVLLKLSAGDFRIGMIASTLMLAGVCLAMILTTRRLRGGQTRLADAFFPLALLHLSDPSATMPTCCLRRSISASYLSCWIRSRATGTAKVNKKDVIPIKR